MADLFLGEDVDAATHARSGARVNLPSSELTTHGVIVGMTGSGKTGLGIVLIEDCLSSGIPTLLIDPKGDLANLCLTFPELRPSDFRPWVNDGDAQKAGLSPDDFAAQQAKAWTDGLASWGLGPADIAALRTKAEFTIYTPGSKAGMPVNIVGSLQAPADTSDLETMRDEIGGYVSGLLGMVGIDADPLSSREHILLSNLIETAWSQGQSLDLPMLVGQVQTPPIRKLGVFDLDTFFPPPDRTALALKLNGLLASPSFSAWAEGPPLDIESMLHTPDGRPRCAIVSIAHLSDEERQFVTTLVLSKLVTWMRRQSGTTDLRALLYMDEVAGYLPPTAMPPTKRPIMLLMKQARAFGVGVVLSTQNPVDIDYKAISNAGTWMIGRLQTDRDKQRLLDGLGAADGGVDVQAVGDTISALGKREFVLRRASKDKPETFTSRWSMSYLRGPLSRDQIALVAGASAASAAAPAPPAASASGAAGGASAIADALSNAVASATGGSPAPAPAALGSDPDASPVMPEVAAGVPVRYVDIAAPWLGTVGGSSQGTRLEAAVVARVKLRYDDEKAGIVSDEEYETVLFPISDMVDATKGIDVDYDDRDLLPDPQNIRSFRLTRAPIDTKTFWSRLERDLVDNLVRNKTIEVSANTALKLTSRPGEAADAFADRCKKAASDAADAETAKLRDKYEDKTRRLQEQLQAAQDRIDVIQQDHKGRVTNEVLSEAGSILGSLLGGRGGTRSLAKSVLGGLGGAASRRNRTAVSGERLDAAQNKVQSLQEDLQTLEDELAKEVSDIDDAWNDKASSTSTLTIDLERTDVSVAQLVLAWIPVP